MWVCWGGGGRGVREGEREDEGREGKAYIYIYMYKSTKQSSRAVKTEKRKKVSRTPVL